MGGGGGDAATRATTYADARRPRNRSHAENICHRLIRDLRDRYEQRRRILATPSLPLESALHASLSDGEAPDTQSLEALREQLRCMQLRLAESECCASNLSSELGFREDNYSVTLARLQNEHVYALQTLESSLRAEVRAAAPLNRTRSAPLTSVVGVHPTAGHFFSLALWLQPRPHDTLTRGRAACTSTV